MTRFFIHIIYVVAFGVIVGSLAASMQNSVKLSNRTNYESVRYICKDICGDQTQKFYNMSK